MNFWRYIPFESLPILYFYKDFTFLVTETSVAICVEQGHFLKVLFWTTNITLRLDVCINLSGSQSVTHTVLLKLNRTDLSDFDEVFYLQSMLWSMSQNL